MFYWTRRACFIGHKLRSIGHKVRVLLDIRCVFIGYQVRVLLDTVCMCLLDMKYLFYLT